MPAVRWQRLLLSETDEIGRLRLREFLQLPGATGLHGTTIKRFLKERRELEQERLEALV